MVVVPPAGGKWRLITTQSSSQSALLVTEREVWQIDRKIVLAGFTGG
jgi:hypothetical protein